MNKKILIADDDKNIRKILRRVFLEKSWEIIESDNGLTTLEIIKKEFPDIILLDINLPQINGKDILINLKKDLRTTMIPIIMITGNNDNDEKIHNLKIGADDYIFKPFDINEIFLKVCNLINRQIITISTNPLTKLPGTPLIENLANKKTNAKEDFAFLYIDIDNFKAYNDAYGYLKGDLAIKTLSFILKNIYNKYSNEDYFCGHIGGDDFIVISSIDLAEKVASDIALNFDLERKNLYSEKNISDGYIISKNRQGEIKKFPIMTLSISIVTNENRIINNYGRIIDLSFEIKKYLKSLKNRKSSMFLKDRRKD